MSPSSESSTIGLLEPNIPQNLLFSGTPGCLTQTRTRYGESRFGANGGGGGAMQPDEKTSAQTPLHQHTKRSGDNLPKREWTNASQAMDRPSSKTQPKARHPHGGVRRPAMVRSCPSSPASRLYAMSFARRSDRKCP